MKDGLTQEGKGRKDQVIGMIRKQQRIRRWIPAGILLFVLLLWTVSAGQVFAATDYPEKESNDTAGTATEVKVAKGNTFTGKFTEDADEEDWFHFNLVPGSLVVFELSAEPTEGSTSFSVDYYLYKSKTTDLFQDTYEDKAYYNDDLGIARTRQTVLLSTGNWYLRLCSVRSVRYQVKILKVSKWQNYPGRNNTMGTAVKIKDGKTYKGLLPVGEYYETPSSGFHFYKLTLKKKSRCTITLWNKGYDNNESGVGNGAPGIITLDAKGEPVERIEDCGHTRASSDTLNRYKRNGRSTYHVMLPKGTTVFKVYAYHDGLGYRGDLYQFSVTRKPGKVKGIKAKRKGRRTIQISWKKKAGVTGYQIFRATGKKGKYKRIKTLKGAGKTSFTDKKKKKKGVRYYYKVRVYRIVNGVKIPGAWSKKVSVK